MKTTFLDTSYLLALVLQDDAHHEQALAWQRKVAGRLVTSEYVLAEFVDALCEPRLRSIAVKTVTLLRQKAAVQVVPASTALLDEGLQFFGSHSDKAWGLTDCIFFLIMHREQIGDALTSDHHFEQAGFRALLRIPPNP